MKSIDDLNYIRDKIETWYRKVPVAFLRAESKELLGYDIEDSGVPREMQGGDPDEEGYVEWKIIPSKINELEIRDLEKEYNIQFPDIYKAYLLSYCHLGLSIKIGDRHVFLPEIPSDYPLKEIKSQLNNWRPLVNAGFIPFGEYEDGWGPVCFDAKSKNNDYSIIWFEHEELFSNDFEECANFEILKRNICLGFRELIESIC